jgi:type I restriction enzyme, S subunit
MTEWYTVKLGELASSKQGAIAIGPFGSRMKADTYVEQGIPVVRGTNISDTRGWKGDWVYVSEEMADSMPNCNVHLDDLVFPHRGSIGEVAIVPSDLPRYMLSTSLMKFTADKQKANPLYLFYYFRSAVGRQEILSYASQVGTPGIGQPLSSLRSFRVILPSISEQRLIAAILSALDDKIELNRSMNETLESMARSIYKDWFVDFAPTHAKSEARAPYLAPELWSLFPANLGEDEKPLGWKIDTLGNQFRLTMGQSPPGETYNEQGEGLPFFQGRTDFGFRYPEQRIFCTSPTRFADSDDTLVSVRAPVGALNMAWERCCIGRGVAAVRHQSGSRSFTYYAMRLLQPELSAYEHSGTVFGAINKAQFEALPIIIPPSNIIKAFEEIARPLDDRIRHNTAENMSLGQLRDLLLPKLISGEIRLKEADDIIGGVL